MIIILAVQTAKFAGTYFHGTGTQKFANQSLGTIESLPCNILNYILSIAAKYINILKTQSSIDDFPFFAFLNFIFNVYSKL